MKTIKITKARKHNLKNINIEIPKNQFVVATGVSGSGKSSLVFDTLFEEGQRQYLDSVGIFKLNAEESFDSIEGLGPTIAVKQGTQRASNVRSLVGTKTKILNYLYLLFEYEGRTECRDCGNFTDLQGNCADCGNQEVRLKSCFFSFVSPMGMCFECFGKGTILKHNIDKLIPDKNLTLAEICLNNKIIPDYVHKNLYRIYDKFKFDQSTPYCKIPFEAEQAFLHGGIYKNSIHFNTVVGVIEKKFKQGEDVNGLVEYSVCPSCNGYRLSEDSLRVKINGKHIGELASMTLDELMVFLADWEAKNEISEFGRSLVLKIKSKIQSLINLKLGYLSLYRSLPTLSGGELQRVSLMTHLDSKLESLIYIFDEPTAGLHEAEKDSLIQKLIELKELGNSVVVVEHDKQTIQKAEHLIEFGPGAGINGGEVVFQGSYAEMLKSSESLTGKYLSAHHQVHSKKRADYTPVNQNTAKLIIKNAQTNNLKNIDVEIPLGMIVGIAGVSGCGKSSLIKQTLLPLLKTHFKELRNRDEEEDSGEDQEIYLVNTRAGKLQGVESLSGFAEVNQAPIGRHRSSNPVTYIKLFDKIRNLFVKNNAGTSIGDFSFNSAGGCTECNGMGYKTVDLGDLRLETVCPVCAGNKYSEEVLALKFNGKNIAEVLNLTISEAIEFFKEQKEILRVLHSLEKNGLEYITLGQPSPTLSGGEAQRIKLAKELSRKRKGNILYILDEPTTGLSMHDVHKLIKILADLKAHGHSVIIIEHDVSVLSYCDWIIELGPDGGNKGGYLMAEGSPFELAEKDGSLIGKYLKEELGLGE